MGISTTCITGKAQRSSASKQRPGEAIKDDSFHLQSPDLVFFNSSGGVRGVAGSLGAGRSSAQAGTMQRESGTSMEFQDLGPLHGFSFVLALH